MLTRAYRGDKPVTSNYGMRGGHFHDGTDFGLYYEDVLATKKSKVKLVARDGYGGLYVWLKHLDLPSGEWSLHHDSVRVKAGDILEEGQVYATSGNSGNSTGPHMHFAWLKDGNVWGSHTDPVPHIQTTPEAQPEPPQLTNLIKVGNTSNPAYSSLSLISRDLFKSPNWMNATGWEEVLSYNPHLRTGNYNNIPSGEDIFMPGIVPAPSTPVNYEEEIKKRDEEIKRLKEQFEVRLLIKEGRVTSAVPQ